MTLFHPAILEEQTETLAIQLQLQELESLKASSKGKAKEGALDIDLALQLYQQDLENNAMILFDRRMASSIARAVQLDGRAVKESTEAEVKAAKDRAIAVQMAGRTDPSRIISENNAKEEDGDEDDELLEKFTALYVTGFDGRESLANEMDGEGEPAASAVTQQTRKTAINRRCDACNEMKKFFDIARAPCRHEYCRECLNELFRASMTDKSLFPPRCCRRPIPLRTVQVFLNPKLVQAYKKRKAEFETPNRTYCSSPICSAFVPPERVRNDVATCHECGTATCVTCKAAAHGGDCPNDEALQQLLATAAERGWQRCYSCWRLVELDTGCNHMTCRCGAQFCYVCGRHWKSCECAQWNEHHLLARANQIVDREPELQEVVPAAVDAGPAEELPLPAPEGQDGDAPAPPLRERGIANVMRNLRQHHDCNHDRWRWISGPHECEECHHHLPQYIFQCRQCYLRACNRCRRHRL